MAINKIPILYKYYYIVHITSHAWAVFRYENDISWNTKIFQATTLKACKAWIDNNT